MLILEKPYVSSLLIDTIIKNNYPVLRNAFSEQLLAEGNNLRLVSDEEGKAEYKQNPRLYSVSENALNWIYTHLKGEQIVEKIGLLKDKAVFRKMCATIYPDFFYKEIEMSELLTFDSEQIPFPVVLKPSVGFLSAGVYVIKNQQEWNSVIEDIKQNFEKSCAQFPDYVLGASRFLIEEYIKGEEFAVDAYFDEKGEPIVLNIFHHKFLNEEDVSDRVYNTSKAIYDKYYTLFVDFLKEVNKVMNLQNFPIHIEFRYDGKKAVPIEINPLRFAGFCLNELQYYISGIHPVEAYLNGIKPDYEAMWKGRENDTYTFLVLERPEGSTTETLVDKQKVYDYFENILQFRVPQDKNVNVLALLFTQTSPKNLHQLDDLLAMNMNEFVLK